MDRKPFDLLRAMSFVERPRHLGRRASQIFGWIGEHLESLKDYFDRQASSWDEMLNYEKRTSELSDLVSWFGLAEGDRVLDVGTGTGILLPWISQAIGPRGMLIGFDLSFKMLEMAKLREWSGEKILLAATAESIPLRSDLFDRIVCFSAFPHFSNKAKALIEMVRVLKSNGTLFIAHLKSVDELNQFHHDVGGPVARDLLPHPERIRSLMAESGLWNISMINHPGKFLAQGKKI
jgi:ubiquinone/menaquinone biosynthesis C-methylase UbiE